MEKPTELQPKQEWINNRFDAVCNAIAAKYADLQPIPIIWIEEYNELLTLINNDGNNS